MQFFNFQLFPNRLHYSYRCCYPPMLRWRTKKSALGAYRGQIIDIIRLIENVSAGIMRIFGKPAKKTAHLEHSDGIDVDGNLQAPRFKLA